MAWTQCEVCGYWFDEQTTQNNGRIIFKGYEIGVGCDYCQNSIREGEKKC